MSNLSFNDIKKLKNKSFFSQVKLTRGLTINFIQVYFMLKNKNKKINSHLNIYNIFFQNILDHKILRKNNILFLDFSKKQMFATKTNFQKKVLYNISNDVFLKKINSTDLILKKKFFLTKEFLYFFFKKILFLENNKTILILKGHSNDLSSFFKKLEKLNFLILFKVVILNFSENFNLNKKKRIRSIKKRFKKSFLKNENKIIRNFLKKN